MEIQLKYDGNKPGKPGEIVQIRINYFTKPARRGGYLVLRIFNWYFVPGTVSSTVLNGLGEIFERYRPRLNRSHFLLRESIIIFYNPAMSLKTCHLQNSCQLILNAPNREASPFIVEGKPI